MGKIPGSVTGQTTARAAAIARVSTAIVLCAVCLLVGLARASAGKAAPQPQTPRSRMLDVWLDLRLLAIFYPETTAKTFLPNLRSIAKQLNQHLSPLRFGAAPRDVMRFRAGVVVINRNAPPQTWILYSRSRTQAWLLIDDPAGHLKIRPLRIP